MPERSDQAIPGILFYRRVAKTDRVLLDQTEEIAAKAVEALIADGIEKSDGGIQWNRFARSIGRGICPRRKRNAKLRNHVHRQSERDGRRDRQDQCDRSKASSPPAAAKSKKSRRWGSGGSPIEVDKHREGFYVLFAISANGDIVKECERRLRVMDAVIKYITVRTDDEVRRLEKMRNFRQKRAARRGSGASAAPTQVCRRGYAMKSAKEKTSGRTKAVLPPKESL